MNKNQKLGVFLFVVWILLVIAVILDPQYFSDTITPAEALQNSSFVRTMFMDIGAVSTLAAIWIYFSSEKTYRYFFAVAVLFVGSFALLPYVGLWLYNRPVGKK